MMETSSLSNTKLLRHITWVENPMRTKGRRVAKAGCIWPSFGVEKQELRYVKIRRNLEKIETSEYSEKRSRGIRQETRERSQ